MSGLDFFTASKRFKNGVSYAQLQIQQGFDNKESHQQARKAMEKRVKLNLATCQTDVHTVLHVKVEPSPSSFLVFTTTMYHSFSAWRGEDLRFAAVHFKGMEPMQRLQDPSGSSTLRLLRSAQRQLKHEQC